MAKAPMGLRNSNPGNIVRIKGVDWEGQSAKQTGRFVTFDSPIHGIRAIARVLISYADKRKARNGSRINTVREIIDRWAPPNENDSTAYSDHVAAVLKVAPDDALTIKEPATMYNLIDAIIRHENGSNPYTRAQIEKGMLLAGIEAPQQSLQKSRTIQSGQVATIAGAATTAAGIAQAVAPTLPVIEWARDNVSLVLILTGLVIVASVGYMIWARIHDRMRGLR